MGDPRKFGNKYEHPKKLWESARINEESALKREYGLKTMRELWVMNQELKVMRREARRLLSVGEDERERDLPKLMNKLDRLGILGKDSKLEQVLSLGVKDILERRLQTRVYKKGLAKSAKQARQLITHGFISVSGRKTDAPSYLVPVSEDESVSYYKKIDLNAGEILNEEPAAEKKEEAKEEVGKEAAADASPKEESAPKEEAPAAAEPAKEEGAPEKSNG